MIENHSPFKNELRLNRADHDTAKKLVKEFNLNVESQGYHYEGNFYDSPDRYEFPIAFFDLYGYIIIESEHELRSKMNVNQRVHKFGGISRMQNHIKFSHEPGSIENYQEIVKEYESRKTLENKEFRNINQVYLSKCLTILDQKLIEIHNTHKSFDCEKYKILLIEKLHKMEPLTNKKVEKFIKNIW